MENYKAQYLSKIHNQSTALPFISWTIKKLKESRNQLALLKISWNAVPYVDISIKAKAAVLCTGRHDVLHSSEIWRKAVSTDPFVHYIKLPV